MGQVITVSEPALDRILYGDKSRILSGYLASQLQAINPAYNEFAARIHNAVHNAYTFVTDKLAQYGIMNEIANMGQAAIDNHYHSIQSFQELQNANFTMQRWVMAHPGVRQLYVDQNLDGYSNTYENHFGKYVGDDDYNYRRVMDGVLRETNDGRWAYTRYNEDLHPGDVPLTLFERHQVLNTWETIDWLLDTCQFDFTSQSENPPKINRS